MFEVQTDSEKTRKLNVQFHLEKIRDFQKEEERVQALINRLIEDTTRMPPSYPLYDYESSNLEKAKDKLTELRDLIEHHKARALHIALIWLDYRPHTELFLRLASNYRVSTFLLHGSGSSNSDYRGYSIRSLLKRLIHSTSNGSVTELIDFDLSSNVVSKDVNDLWRSLASRYPANIPNKRKREDIVNGVCAAISKRLEHEEVILVFRGIDYIPDALIKPFIQELWNPLARGIHAQGPHKHLWYMLLVDYSGKVIDIEIPYIEPKHDESWKPDMSIRLPIVTHFSDQDLLEWIQREISTLQTIRPGDSGNPDHLVHVPVEDIVQDILKESSNGEPVLVMKCICDKCEYYLEGIEECLRL